MSLLTLYNKNFNFKKSLTNTQINKLHKHIDKSIEKYYCNVCNIYHKRFFNKKLNTKFFNHLFHKVTISNTQIWKNQFKKTWNKYSIEKHTKTIGSEK